MDRLIIWFWNRYRPQEGWLPLGLVISLVICLIWALMSAAWVPEISVVIPAGLYGVLLGVLLAKRPLRALTAWTLILLYGLFGSIAWLGNLWPSWGTLHEGWGAMTTFWRQNGALFFDRSASWVQAAVSNGRSEETITFALGLALCTWMMAAYMGWSTYRQQRPLLGLTLLGTALALNGYYSNSSAYWVGLFIGLAVLTTAIVHYIELEGVWQRGNVDYSSEIRTELLLYAGGLAIVLMSLSLALPSFSITKFRHYLAQQPTIQQFERTWDRVFGGVEDPRSNAGSGPGRPGGSGIMPRAYLIGNVPELSETVVMTARLVEEVNGRFYPVSDVAGLHWRALSYEVYTGHGWTLTEEREEVLAANQPIPLPPLAAQRTFHQSVNWVFDERAIRYTVGFPYTVDQDTHLLWRGLEDLVRITSEKPAFRATSLLATNDANLLRTAQTADVPPAILARYTALPPTVPAEVHALAARITANLDNPYDQARAIEQYLRQFPYTLDVPAPPTSSDVVAYFLFEQQAGYCDYYASAMVVLARSVGLPARMAAGFLAQPPDEGGVQTIYQINAHSWAEVYFAGYGWVEFEPTGSFPTNQVPQPNSAAAGDYYADEPTDYEEGPLPIPDAPAQRPSPWPWWRLAVVLLLGASLTGWWWWQARQPQPQGILSIYGRFQQQTEKLGAPLLPQQTPHEFREGLAAYLAQLAARPRLRPLVQRMQPPIDRLIAAFTAHQYAPPTGEHQETAVARDAWQQLQRPLYRLRIGQWLHRLYDRFKRVS
ncbi:MAG: transglutaminase-like domain-containing protein [Chloroflexota bacterium]